MVSVASPLELMADLFEYPAPGYRERLTSAAALIAPSNVAVAEFLRAFADSIDGRSLSQLEELYIQTFDLNPDGCLDIGWHLFGEDYARGEFLVNLRREMRRYGIAERDELPDSLLTVLPLAARMPADEAALFRARFLRPAVEKIRKAVPSDSNPFAKLLAALAALLDEVEAGTERPERGEHE